MPNPDSGPQIVACERDVIDEALMVLRDSDRAPHERGGLDNDSNDVFRGGRDVCQPAWVSLSGCGGSEPPQS
jgi:hypothetical protein